MINYPQQVIELNACEDEPLHLIGRIQSYGFLLIVDAKSYSITQLSDNISAFSGYSVEELVGSSFLQLFPKVYHDGLLEWLTNKDTYAIFDVENNVGNWTLHLISHDDLLLIEIEEEFNESLTPLNQLFYVAIEKIEKAATLPILFQEFTDYLLKITGYDRVLLMEFQENWQGEVVSESLLNRKGQSFLHHHFPPQDIPKQVREQLLKGKYRYIPNIRSKSYPVVPYINPNTSKPTSLLNTILRNSSELHLEYLNNMGADSALSFSIIVDGKLWGIVACHNFKPKKISRDRRELSQSLVRFFSGQLKVEREEVNVQLLNIFDSARDYLLRQMTANYDIWAGLTKGNFTLIDINNCDGAAMLWQNQFYKEGNTPSEEDILKLIEWFNAKHPTKDIFYTDHLSYHFPEAEKYTRYASGAMFLKFLEEPGSCLVWFKPEVIRETRWAGNPVNPEKKLVDTPHLHPRKSFSRWIELSRGYSEKWEMAEVQTTKQLQRDITNFIVSANRRLKEVNFKLQETLEEQQQLVEELHAAEEELKQTHDFQKEIIGKLSQSKLGEMEDSRNVSTRIGSLLINKNSNIISFNDLAKHFYNYEFKEGDNFTFTYTEEEKQQYYIFHDRAFNGEKSVREIKRTINGRLKWLKEYFYPVYNEQKEIYAIGCDIQNITQRKQAEDVVHNLALIARNAQNAIIITDKEQKILWVNPSFVQLTGYDKEEVIGKRTNEFLVGEETDLTIINEISNKISRYESSEVELINYHKSGRKYWSHIYIQPYIDTFGEQRFFSIHSDITNQKLVNLAVAESEEKFRLLSENAHDIIALQNNSGEYIYVSPSVENILGYTQEDLIGQSQIVFIHPNYRNILEGNNLYDLIKNNRGYSFEYPFKHYNGDYIWVETSFQVVRKEGQNTESIQSITRNIDIRKKAELALERTNDDLNKVNQELDRFVYSVSHDLRSPIASSLGLIEVMRNEKERSALDEYMELQKQSLNRLDSFISDIVNYSRNNRLEIAIDKIEWQELISSIFSNYSFLPDTEHIEKNIKVKGDTHIFYSDSLRLKIVLANLISNALTYSNPYTDKISFVNVIANISAEKAVLAIEDNGIGIDEKYQGRIFEMFFRANNLKPGSGIGLYIVKETIHKLKGNISFSSQKEKGTSFVIEIPNLINLRKED